MTEFSRLLTYLKPYRIIFVVSIVLMILTGLLEGATSLLLIPIFNGLQGGGVAVKATSGFFDPARYIPSLGNLSGSDSNWYIIPILLIGLTVIKGATEYFSSYSMSYIGQSVIADIRTSLYDHILKQRAAFFGRHSTNALTARLVSDTALVERSVSDTLRDALRESVSITVYIVLLFSLNWKLALWIIALAPPIGLLTTTFNKRLRKSIDSRQESGAEMLDAAQESISSQRVVKVFGMEKYESRKFAVTARKQLGDQLRAMRIYFLSPIVLEFVGIFALAILLMYIKKSIAIGEMSVGSFIAFAYCMFKSYDPIRRLSRQQHDLQQGLTSASRIFKILDENLEMRDKPGAAILTHFSNKIKFKDVSFSYGKLGEEFDIPVVENASFCVHAGEMVAIVGSSGAGKSTLTSLIPRLYDVSDGAIFIDGRDIRDLKLASLREQIAVVSQDVHLFNDTVRANIAYGSYERNDTDEKIKEAARAALADEFIRKLPRGYDTVVGERGMILSGGQRQRVAIARAILKNAPILILDEATSALDTESELLVQKALNNLMEGRTTIVIAHRLSTVARADRILVMSAGRIVETGSHNKLIKQNGLYRRLYELQFNDKQEFTHTLSANA